MPDLRELLNEIESALPMPIKDRLIAEGKYITELHRLDEGQSRMVERALFMGAWIAKEGIKA